MLIQETTHPWVDLNGNNIEDPNEAYTWQIPNPWLPNPNIAGQVDKVESIRYAYLLEGDGYNTPINNILMWGGQNWVQTQIESPGTSQLCDNLGRCVEIVNFNPARDVAMIALNDGHQWGHYYCLAASGNEYSQWPQSYLNNQNLVNTDGLLWYEEGFNIIGGNFPPAGGNWAGVEFCDFQA